MTNPSMMQWLFLFACLSILQCVQSAKYGDEAKGSEGTSKNTSKERSECQAACITVLSNFPFCRCLHDDTRPTCTPACKRIKDDDLKCFDAKRMGGVSPFCFVYGFIFGLGLVLGIYIPPIPPFSTLGNSTAQGLKLPFLDQLLGFDPNKLFS